MDLVTNIITPRIILSGEGNVDLVAGQSLVIETTPDGEEVLNVECPAEKTWAVRIFVEVTETDE